MSYESLNDAAEVTGINGLRPGKTEIWYMNDKGWEIFSRGPALALKTGHPLPIGHVVEQSRTHRLLGKIQATNLGGIFGIMQGESWSPDGAGNALVRANGLHHSSMSVGDIIVLPNGAGHMVDSVGFFELPKNAAEQKDQVRKAQGDISPMLRKESVGMRETLRSLEEAIPRRSPDEGAFTTLRRRVASILNRTLHTDERRTEDELAAMRDLMSGVHAYIEDRWAEEDDAGDGGGSHMLQAADDLRRDFEAIREKAEMLR
jgi:hypothetical protein